MLGTIDHAIENIVANVRREFRANSKYRLKNAEPFRKMILDALECRGFAIQPTNPELLAKLKALPLLGDGEVEDGELEEDAPGLPEKLREGR